jgi:Zn-finger domain-containing protein
MPLHNSKIRKKMDTKTPTLEQVPAMVASLQTQLARIEERLTVPDRSSPELPMKAEACATYLSELEGKNIAVSTVYNRVAQGTLPHHKQGARLWFYRSEILAAIRNASTPETPAIVDQDSAPATLAV